MIATTEIMQRKGKIALNHYLVCRTRVCRTQLDISFCLDVAYFQVRKEKGIQFGIIDRSL